MSSDFDDDYSRNQKEIGNIFCRVTAGAGTVAYVGDNDVASTDVYFLILIKVNI